MKKLFLTISVVTTLIACEKVPFDQYYVWENTTDTLLLLYVNPQENQEHPYFPVTASDNILPLMVKVVIEPHSTYTLHGTMTCDYYDEWFSVYQYPPNDGDYPYVTGTTKYENKID